jgi:O-acetyl-ADP-ribose deacetylase (regulator of RNase III)
MLAPVGKVRDPIVIGIPSGFSYLRGMSIHLIQGDITEQRVDAIVNAANSTLLGGGGVDGAIHRKGGPTILEACRELRKTLYPGGLPTGEAVATTAGDLPARWVIHTVGPVYHASSDPAGELAACHRNALRVAEEIQAQSIAFPAISTGAFGYPVDEAARVAIAAVRQATSGVELVRFVLFDEKSYRAFKRAVEDNR